MRRGVGGDGVVSTWESWTRDRIDSLTQRHVLRSLRPVDAGVRGGSPSDGVSHGASSAEVWVSEPTMRAWEAGAHDLGGSADVTRTTSDGAASDAAGRGAFASSSEGARGENTDTPNPSPASSTRLRLFSSNDYLGLGAPPRVRAAAARAAAAHGSGPRSSPLVCGYTGMHRELEIGLAALKRTEECLLFPSGFAANLGVLPALADGRDCEIFSDRLNHASIVDGCRLARANGAKVTVYDHKDVAQLESLMLQSTARRKLIVTDALFSVDGDFAPLRELVRLKKKLGGAGSGDVALLVDEAHATLVCGATGGGAVEMLLNDALETDDSSAVDVHVGTLSKAFGSHGGFACCSAAMKSLLVSACRTSAFSTALPAPCVAAACAALRVAGTPGAVDPESGVDEGKALRARLWRHVRRVDDALRRGNRTPFRAGKTPARDDDSDDDVPRLLLGGGRLLHPEGIASPIACVAYGSESSALQASAALLRKGLHAPAIRPPTVPSGTSRVRLALSAAHKEADIEALVNALVEKVGDARL